MVKEFLTSINETMIVDNIFPSFNVDNTKTVNTSSDINGNVSSSSSSSSSSAGVFGSFFVGTAAMKEN